jgi:6-phosphogluconate dehydrogenase
MDIGFVGLSGASAMVARRAARAGFNVFGCDREGRVAALADEKVLVALPNAVALARALSSAPRVVWINVDPGRDTELAIQDVWPELTQGDIIVDAGAARHEDAARREAALATVKIHFVDCAVAPAQEDADDGPALYFGGNPAAARIFRPVAERLAPERGWLHCGPAGSAYFLRTMLETVPGQVASMVKTMQSGNPDGNAPLERLRVLCESFGKDASK